MKITETIPNFIKNKDIFPIIVGVITACFVLVLIYALDYYHPVGYSFFVSEDNWGEYGSFVFYFYASILVTIAICRNARYRRPGYIVFALVCFILAMEEISWGQRLFDIETPEVLYQYNIQEELNFHNIVEYYLDIEYAFVLVVGFWGIILPILQWWLKAIAIISEKLGIPTLSIKYWPFLALALFFYIRSPLYRSDEITEILLAFCCFGCAFDIYVDHAKVSLEKRISITAFSITLTLLIIGSIVFLRWYKTDIESLGYNLNWNAQKSYMDKGRYTQAEMIFDYILQHPDFVLEDTYWHFGRLLQQIGKHDKSTTIILAGVKDLDGRISDSVDDLELHLNKGKLYGLLQANTQKMEEFRIVEDKASNYITKTSDSEEREWAFLALAQMSFELGQIEKAIVYLEKAENHASRSNIDYIKFLKDEYLEALEQGE